MSDGREEREELKERLKQEKQDARDEPIDRDAPDGWEPERVDS